MRRPSAGAAFGAVAAVSALLLLVAARSGTCGGKKSSAPLTSASASTDAPDAATRAVHAQPGCHPTLMGGTLATVAPGSLSLAVVKDHALLVGAITDAAKPRAERVVLDRMGAPLGPVEPIDDAFRAEAGSGVTTFASALPEDGYLTTLTYATRRTAKPGGSDCADGLLVSKIIDPSEAADAGARRVTPRRELLTHSCRAATLMSAAARGSLGVALLDGPTAADGDPKTAPAIVDAVVIAGLTSSLIRVETTSGATIASAATAAGATSVAAAWVVAHDGARDLHVVQLGSNGKLATKVEVFDKQNVGTATLAYEGDVLHVVWSSFVPEKKRHVLRWSKWLAGASPSATQSIGTGVLSAVTPSLAVDRGRFLLAWANGDDEKTSTVKVGASTNGVVAIAGLATVVSTSGSLAREPVAALDGDAMFVAWKELGGAEPEVHAASISCRE